jgi:hypothetical protein
MTFEIRPKVRGYLSKRRIVLLASVAAIGASVILAMPPRPFSPAQALPI